jgi:acetolactate synthase-1/2/3 large subunit
MAPKECYDGADVVLALDITDFEGPTHVRDIATRTVVNMVPETATWIDIGFTDVEVSKWSMDYGRTFHAHHRMTADAAERGDRPECGSRRQNRHARRRDRQAA